MRVSSLPSSSLPLGAPRAELSPSEFWQLLLTQLQMQDPFQAGDTGAMLQQFVALQSAQEMAHLWEALQRVQTLLLLGHSVQFETGERAGEGMVVGIRWSGAMPQLLVQAGEQVESVPLSAVTAVARLASSRSPFLLRL